MIDLNQLEKVRQRGGKVIARCPACAEGGADNSGDHLYIAEDGQGPFGCIAYPGEAGSVHRKRIWELVGVRDGGRRPVPPPRIKSAVSAIRVVNRIPSLRQLAGPEMAVIARVRAWPSPVGLELLTRRGLLHAGQVWDAGTYWPAWIACDSTHRNADARRMDGQPWAGINSKAKALTSGARGWPIGADAMAGRDLVVLCEGMPDFAAALLVASWEGLLLDRVAPVCLTGAGNGIHQDALPMFAGKRVRIAVHDDPQGQGLAAAAKWAAQLYQAGARKVDGVNFSGLFKRDGQAVKDLADFTTLLPLAPGSTTDDLTRGVQVLGSMA